MAGSILYAKSDGLNTMFFTDEHGKEKEIDGIELYAKDGSIKYKMRWLSDSPYNSDRGNVNNVQLPDTIKRKLKPSFNNGETFYIPVKERYSWDRNKVILYIPEGDLVIKEVERKPVDYGTRTYDDIAYQVILPGSGNLYFSQRENERQTVANLKEENIDKLIEKSRFSNIRYDIKAHFSELEKLVEQIKEEKERKRVKV